MVNVISSILNAYLKPEASVNAEQPIVVDDGVFTLTIGPSTSGNAENANAGATGAVAVQVHFSFGYVRCTRLV